MSSSLFPNSPLAFARYAPGTRDSPRLRRCTADVLANWRATRPDQQAECINYMVVRARGDTGDRVPSAGAAVAKGGYGYQEIRTGVRARNRSQSGGGSSSRLQGHSYECPARKLRRSKL